MRLPTVILLLLVYISLQICTAKDDLEYVYDDDASKEVSQTDGTRLVGAKRKESSEIPWVVSYVRYKRERSSCTGSLINSYWVLTAAHCLHPLQKYLKNPEDCVEITSKDSFFESREKGCYRLWDGSYKVVPDEKDSVYFGINDFTDWYEIERQFWLKNGYKIMVDYFVGHEESSYSDIALMHLAQPAPAKFRYPVCLPGPHYKDTNYGQGGDTSNQAELAGYGRFKRKPCLTDDYGPSKHHYCKHKQKTCSESLAPRSEDCEAFFNSPETPDDVPEGDTDLILLNKKDKPVYCYPRKSRDQLSKGWCHVGKDASAIGKLKYTDSWGFCSRDCHLNISEPRSQVLRHVPNVAILDDALCKYYLNKALGNRNVKVFPKFVCVGVTKSLNYTVWEKKAGKYVKLDPRKIKFRHRLEKDQILDERNAYVHSAGTCNGDSGGPVYTYDKTKRKNVVLGVVSGGRGYRLRNCGGMNNPTYYARVREFTTWIQDVLSITSDSDDLCIVDNQNA